MKQGFWHQKWENNDIGFHQDVVDPLLLKYFSVLSLNTGGRVFVPLCGKTRDIGWLVSQGYKVVGCELHEKAVQQLFSEMGTEPYIGSCGKLRCYSARNIDIFVGDLFDLTAKEVGTVGAIYDRAALEALPRDMRDRYARHLIQITSSAPQLLLCYEYDQSLQNGPPFSITSNEVRGHYQEAYETVELIDTVNVTGGIKGQCEGVENVWVIKNT